MRRDCENIYSSVTVICGRVCVGVVRSLHALGRLKRVYCTETRPYNQGSRLTAYEAVAEGIPGTLITDSMAALTMREMNITGVLKYTVMPFKKKTNTNDCIQTLLTCLASALFSLSCCGGC